MKFKFKRIKIRSEPEYGIYGEVIHEQNSLLVVCLEVYYIVIIL